MGASRQVSYRIHPSRFPMRPAGFEPATLGLEGRCSIQAELRTQIRSVVVVSSVLIEELAMGIEPMTSSLPRMRSTTELREPTVTGPCDRGGGTRTPNRRFWRPVLYQLSYAPGSALPWLGTDLNRRHPRFQRGALPTELPSRTFVAPFRAIQLRGWDSNPRPSG